VVAKPSALSEGKSAAKCAIYCTNDEINSPKMGQTNGKLLNIKLIQWAALAAHLPISRELAFLGQEWRKSASGRQCIQIFMA
jgi:hypothetical protein